MIFLALAALVSSNRGKPWIRAALAGLAVGMAVSEGFDVGAICSLMVAAFALFQTLVQPGQTPGKLLKAGVRVAVVALFAAFLAAQSLSALVGTQVQGIAGTQQDIQTREQQWDWATQWSLPKVETLRVLVAGLFGYRLDTPNGGEYWGTVGRQPGWEIHHHGFVRHSGSGEYAGVLVVLIAAWSVSQGFRRKENAFNPTEKKFVRFWAVTAFISLLLAFGRHAPFYRIIYALPYFSTIRNPIKFMHPFQISLLILFGYGLQGLSRLYLEKAAATVKSIPDQLKSWWASASAFEKRWTTGLALFVGLSIVGLLIYSSSTRELQNYLSANGFGPPDAQAITSFSVKEVGWFIFFLLLSAASLLLIFSGWFSGPRAKFAAVLLGLILVSDLVRANQPWILFYNYKEKYASNPIADFLRQKPYEARVSILPFQVRELETLQQVYGIYWMQHTFPFYNIQSLDVVQEPRMPEEKIAFQNAVGNSIVKYWQLTNTRYLLGLAGIIDSLNQQLDPQKHRFRNHTLFTMGQEKADGPIIVQTNTTGPFALLEFTGALPRAKLYSNWQVITNTAETLKTLGSTNFNPEETVLVSRQLPSSPVTASTNTPGNVEITSYAPKDIKLKSDASSATVLLLNDRYDPDWKVTLDGKPETLFRANYIMRGVYLPAGSHTIEFRFQPSVKALYVTLAAMASALILLLLLFVGKSPAKPEPA